MSELLVVEGATLEVKSPAEASGTITILPASIKSDSVKCSGNKAYHNISFTVSAYSSTAITSGAGAGVISGNSVKNKGNSLSFVLGDANVEIKITDTVDPKPTEFATIGIANPNQDKVRMK